MKRIMSYFGGRLAVFFIVSHIIIDFTLIILNHRDKVLGLK